MRKNFFFAAFIAALTFTGCANDEYVGEVENPKGELSEISFVGKNGALSRTTTHSGNDAAQKLNKKFYVYGTKHTTNPEDGNNGNDVLVFKNYRVEYTDGSTSATNTRGWEYVGLSFEEYEKQNVIDNTDGKVQTPKYWDYGAENGYTFYAFSANLDDIRNSNVNVTKITTGDNVYEKGYEFEVKQGATLTDIYVADRNPVKKPTPVGTPYGEVVFTFRNIVSKVRVGFYETIPGYSVKINNMYGADGSTPTNFALTGQGKFAAICPNKMADQEATTTVTVTYYNNTETVLGQTLENQPKVATGLTPENSLELGAGVINNKLGELSKQPTWDTPDNNIGKYTLFWPQPDNTTNMKIKVDYTLTSTDGSGETITVKGATAEIPSQYVAWKPGFAYTYLFKISDNTNGSTGTPGTDPEGLFPITFDAVVVDSESDGLHEYITTVSKPSITTHSKGSAVTTDGEYQPGAVIYIVTIGDDGNPVPFNGDKMKLYRVTCTDTKYEITENAVIEAIDKASGDKLSCIEVESSDNDKLEGSTTVPDSDNEPISVDAAMFKAGAAGTVYAFVYESASEKYAKVIRIKQNP